jgi:type IV secretory pathway TrbD component
VSRLTRAWDGLGRDQRLAALAAAALLVTMFFPWYGLQSVNRKTGTISSHTINAFGDVSFVEAAVFLVAVSVVIMLVARAEDRNFQLPGGDGTIVMVAGGWAAVLIFYRVFDRPSGGGYPVGIEWGFFLAFLAAGALAYAGWRLRALAATARPGEGEAATGPDRFGEGHREHDDSEETVRVRAREPVGSPLPASSAPESGAPAAQEAAPAHRRPRYPPAPGEQMSLGDPPAGHEQRD